MISIKKALAVTAVLVGVCAFGEDAHVCHWTGEENSDWWNPNNWKEGIVPGSFRTSSGLTNETGRGYTAVFSYSTNRFVRVNPVTSSALALKMLTIDKIVISGSDAPEYVFGGTPGTDEAPFLPLVGGGSIVVSADVERSPTFAATLIPGVRETSAQTFVIRNDAKVPLRLKNLSAYVGVEQYARAAGGDWFCSTLSYQGAGDIEIAYTAFESSNWSLATELAMNGGRLLVKSAVENVYQLKVAGEGRQTLDIAAGASFALDCRKGTISVVDNDLLVTGGGSFIWSATDSGQSANNPIEVNDGAELVFDTGVTLTHAALDAARVLDGETGGGAFFTSTTAENPGLVRMNGAADFPGALRLGGGVTYECATVGKKGAAGTGQTGRGQRVRLGGGACLRYVGAGETSDKSIYLVDAAGTVENAGAGRLLFANVTGGTTSYVLTVAPGGEVGFTGASTAVVALADGAKLVAESGTVSYSKLKLLGAAVLTAESGATVTVTSVERTAGGLDLDGVGVVKMSSLTAGRAPGWLTVGGTAAVVASSGKAVTSRAAAPADYQIDVHDDVIPNAAGKIVEIAKTAKTTTGPDTLAADTTTISLLRQRQAADEAVVRIGSTQKLAAEAFSVGEGAQSLTLGETKGTGKVVPVNGRLELEVLDETASLGVNSAIDLGSAPLIKTGVGTAKVFSPFAGTVQHWAGPLTFFNLDGNAALTLKGGEGTFAFAGKASPYSLQSAANAEQTPSGDGLVVSTTGSVPMSNLQVGSGNVLTMDGVKIYQSNATEVKTNVTETIPGFAYVGSNSVGVLNFDAGTFTGKVLQAGGTAANAKSALFMRGGELVNVCNARSNGGDWVMGIGYSYLEITGGKYTIAGDWQAGYNGQANVVIGPGGTLSHSKIRQSRIRFGGYDCDVSLYVDGGTFDYFDGNDFAYIPMNGSTAFCMQFTVDNGGVADFGSRYINFAHMTPTARQNVSVFNLNDGGSVRAAYIIRSNSRVHTSDYGTATDPNYTNSLSFVQFNGGIWRNGSASAPFGEKKAGNWAVAPTAVYSFEKGATLDISLGNTVTLPFGGSIQAPYGQGLESVRMTAAFAAMKFIGAPSVRIRGDGVGATAVALFDAARGTVREIRVTGRGCGYTTATADVYYGFSGTPVKVASLPTTLSANVSGGLTKTGPGTLVLQGTNTYTGATVVREGTVRIANRGVLNPDSGISLEGGTFDLNGNSIMLADFGGNGTGQIKNGSISLTGLVIDMNEVKAGKVDVLDFTNPVTFGSSATIRLLNATDETLDRNERYPILKFANRLPETMPEIDSEVYENLATGWRILVAEDQAILRYTGGSLYIVY